MWGFQRTLVISGCHVSISPVLNWYRLQQRNPRCIRGEDHVFHVSSFALAMLYKSKIPDYMHWKKNSVLRILPIWQAILASKHLMTLYLALFLQLRSLSISPVLSRITSPTCSCTGPFADFDRVQPRSITEPQSVWFLICSLATGAPWSALWRAQSPPVLLLHWCFWCPKAKTIRLQGWNDTTDASNQKYSNSLLKCILQSSFFARETNQHWGTIYIFWGLAISTTEDGKGSLGLRSPFSSNSLLLAALFNCGCLSLSTTTANCHLTHIVIDVMTVIVHLGFLQVRPGIEGGVQLWLHITPAGLRVLSDSCLIWASRQASVNIHTGCPEIKRHYTVPSFK